MLAPYEGHYRHDGQINIPVFVTIDYDHNISQHCISNIHMIYANEYDEE